MRKRKLSQSPQARWARKKKAAGCCARCGQPRNRYRQLCDAHQQEFTTYMRARRAHKRALAADRLERIMRKER